VTKKPDQWKVASEVKSPFWDHAKRRKKRFKKLKKKRGDKGRHETTAGNAMDRRRGTKENELRLIGGKKLGAGPARRGGVMVDAERVVALTRKNPVERKIDYSRVKVHES